MIKAVIFDVDGVLIDSFEANFKFFSDLMNKFGYNFLSKEDFPTIFHLPMKDVIRRVSKSNNEEEIEKIWKSGKDRDVPYPHELLSIPNDLEKVIESLSKDYILGIVTSRSRSGIFSVPQLKKLEKYFIMNVSYEDTKNHKPHPEPLILAAQKIGLKPDECVYVGDSESDIIAAKAAGMKSIIYNKKKLADADANFSLFRELPEIIRSF